MLHQCITRESKLTGITLSEHSVDWCNIVASSCFVRRLLQLIVITFIFNDVQESVWIHHHYRSNTFISANEVLLHEDLVSKDFTPVFKVFMDRQQSRRIPEHFKAKIQYLSSTLTLGKWAFLLDAPVSILTYNK